MLRNSLYQRRKQGFTLIELVIVIVIIGILAAIALPKFAALSADARAGAVKGLAGSLASANVAIYAKANTLNKAGTTGSDTLTTTQTGCAATITLAFGYANAIGTPGATNAASTDLVSCVSLTPTTDFVAITNGIAHAGAATANRANCAVTYVAPTAAGQAPTYTIDVSNCS